MNLARQKMRTGLLAAVSLGILAVVVCSVSARQSARLGRTPYFIYFTDARGIELGTSVTAAGVVIGQVVEITAPTPEQERPSPELEAKVEVRLARSATIYRDARVQVVRESLLGEPLINFGAGHAAGGLAAAGTSFRGEQIQSVELSEPAKQAILDVLIGLKSAVNARHP